ncbi:hypothetical protein O181_031782 [Austropuccinia psidii MF-1]|uniref:Uncharacterized protein n=1 Tax=Austropuccinia psidii MF-1 TaxID=1389203 RepID=A0A9Q3CYA2_9BASI|nr:hypothetical protein [Austropuccinia psidii MF-1]
MQNYIKGLASRLLDQLSSHPSIIYSLQELMDITLDLYTRYYERKKEKNNFQEKKTEASKSSSAHTRKSSNSSNNKKNCRVQKRDKPHSSLFNKDHKLMCVSVRFLYETLDNNNKYQEYYDFPQ